MNKTEMQKFLKLPCIGDHVSHREQCVVEDRGPGFGKIYVLWRGGRNKGRVQAIMLWSGLGVSHGTERPSDECINRAVRALAETPRGRMVLGVDEQDIEADQGLALAKAAYT